MWVYSRLSRLKPRSLDFSLSICGTPFIYLFLWWIILTKQHSPFHFLQRLWKGKKLKPKPFLSAIQKELKAIKWNKLKQTSAFRSPQSSSQLKDASQQEMTFYEMKSTKNRRVRGPDDLSSEGKISVKPV